MRITCPECYTQYNLDPAKVPARGQNVRCTKCAHVWHFTPPREEGEGETDSAGAIDALQGNLPVQSAPDFSEMLAEGDDGHGIRIDTPPVMPSFVHADIHVPPPAPFIDHRPFGLSANGFTAMLAIILFGVTFSALLLAKNVIVPRYPPALAFYQMIGAQVKAPGEGLRLAALQARGQESEDGKMGLGITGKLENISGAAQDYPSLRFIAKDKNNDELRDWKFHPDHAVLAPGDALPLKFSFDNLPPETAHVDIIAIRK